MKVEINQKLSTSCSRQVHKVFPAIWFCSVSLTMQDFTQGCTFYSRLSHFWFLREMLVLQTIRCSLPNPQPQGHTAGHLFDCMKKKKKEMKNISQQWKATVRCYIPHPHPNPIHPTHSNAVLHPSEMAFLMLWVTLVTSHMIKIVQHCHVSSGHVVSWGCDVLPRWIFLDIIIFWSNVNIW